MKKLLLSALIAATSLTAIGCISETTKAAEFKQVTLVGEKTFGWAHCDWDYTNIQKVEKMRKEGGWTVVSTTPLNYETQGYSGTVDCIGYQIVFTR